MGHAWAIILKMSFFSKPSPFTYCNKIMMISFQCACIMSLQWGYINVEYIAKVHKRKVWARSISKATSAILCRVEIQHE